MLHIIVIPSVLYSLGTRRCAAVSRRRVTPVTHAPESSPPHRAEGTYLPTTSRRVAVSAAWAVPAVALSTAAPASAASVVKCDPSKISRPRPAKVEKPDSIVPKQPTEPANPHACQPYKPSREKSACVTWRRDIWDPYQEKLAKWKAQKTKIEKAEQEYAAYKADDAAWDKENPGCNKVVPRPTATSKPAPTAKPTTKPTSKPPANRSQPEPPAEPPRPTRPRGQCTPWNKWNVVTENFRSFGIPGDTGSHAAFHISVSQNKPPQGGCKDPVDNRTERIRVEVLRAAGGGKSGVRGMDYYRASPGLVTPIPVYKPKSDWVYNEGDVTWAWDLEIHPQQIFENWGFHKYTNVNIVAQTGNLGITNRIRVNGYVPEKWNTIIKRQTNTF